MIVKGQTDPLTEMRGSRQIDASDLDQYSTTIFLDATTQVVSVRPSVRLSVGPCVRPLVRPSVHPSVSPSVGWSRVIYL